MFGGEVKAYLKISIPFFYRIERNLVRFQSFSLTFIALGLMITLVMSNSHIVEVKEFADDSGDVYIEIPTEVMEGLGWKEDDDLKFLPQRNGSMMIKKVKLETVELDFDDCELFKYMQLAHAQGISFNQLCENALSDAITKAGFENECG